MSILNVVMRIIRMSCSSSTNLTPIAWIDTTTSIHVILLNEMSGNQALVLMPPDTRTEEGYPEEGNTE